MFTRPLDFLPGDFSIGPGSPSDYRALAAYHYRARPPRTWAAVWTVRFAPRASGPPSLVAVAVLAWPTAVNLGRENALGWRALRYGEKIRLANANVRTISRVIVHPQFRSLGLASALIRCTCAHCPTRYCEASAQMGRAHPLFTRAGMTRFEPVDTTRPIYYLWDRDAPHQATRSGKRSALNDRARCSAH
jgi:GNAT superfamily N-acetyltransferase